MIGQLPIITNYDKITLVTIAWSLSRKAWTWCVPSHSVSEKIYCSRCETCTKFVYVSLIIEL